VIDIHDRPKFAAINGTKKNLYRTKPDGLKLGVPEWYDALLPASSFLVKSSFFARRGQSGDIGDSDQDRWMNVHRHPVTSTPLGHVEITCTTYISHV